MSNIGRDILRDEKNMGLNDLYLEMSKRIIREYESEEVPSDIGVRKITYKWLKMLVLLEKLIGNHHVKVIKDESVEVDRPKLYTFTTGGNNDLKTVFSLIKNPAWLPVMKTQYHGDFETFLYRSHFVTWYDENDQKLKKALMDRQRKVLLNGGSLICFPEKEVNGVLGTGEINREYADIVVHTNPVIIPVALQEYTTGKGTTCYVNIGRNLDLHNLKEEYMEEVLIIMSEELKRLKEQIISRVGDRYSMSSDNRVVDNDRYLLMKR